MLTASILIQFTVLFVAALATGGLVVNWIGLTRAMARMRSAAAYTEFHQATNFTFDPYMPIVVFGAILGGGGLVLTAPLGLHSAAGLLAIGGALFYAAGVAITLATNVPLNRLMATWSVSAPPADWSATRGRWIHFHILRTLLSVPALACYLLSVLLNSRG